MASSTGIERKCTICGDEGAKTHMVVTTKMDEVCWPCVSEAVSYYKDAMNEE